MKKLQVLLLLLWCSVLALASQASPLTCISQYSANQQVASENNTLAAILFQEINYTDPEALPLLDETLFTTIAQSLLKLSPLTFLSEQQVLVSHSSSKSDNGLHTIFTAGP
ncbi:hypothetical protein ABS362_04190 [Pontibacter populi]|uniref:Uncharacterized protein n=2 Tax=Pontibacter populi TaxID=890055 RepID=A0ABV1RQT1_9BACT